MVGRDTGDKSTSVVRGILWSVRAPSRGTEGVSDSEGRLSRTPSPCGSGSDGVEGRNRDPEHPILVQVSSLVNFVFSSSVSLFHPCHTLTDPVSSSTTSAVPLPSTSSWIPSWGMGRFPGLTESTRFPTDQNKSGTSTSRPRPRRDRRDVHLDR